MADAESKRRRRLNATVALRWDHSALTRDHHGIGQVGILYCLAEAREKLPILIDGGNPLGCLSAFAEGDRLFMTKAQERLRESAGHPKFAPIDRRDRGVRVEADHSSKTVRCAGMAGCWGRPFGRKSAPPSRSISAKIAALIVELRFGIFLNLFSLRLRQLLFQHDKKSATQRSRIYNDIRAAKTLYRQAHV